MSELQEMISIQEHMTLPFKHKIAHPIDMADLRLSEAKKELEKRLKTLGDRLDNLDKKATAIDPKGLTPTPRSERFWEIHDKVRSAYWSVKTRLSYVQQALTLISDVVSESYDHRNKVIQARKARVAK